MKCVVPGCEEASVVQWRKLLDDDATSAHIEDLQGRLAQVSEAKRLDIRIRMASLEDAFASPPTSLSPPDIKAFQDRASAQIEAAREEHNAVPTTFDLEHQREHSTLALGHCESHSLFDEDHSLPDGGDWYATLHAADCSDALGCGCS